MEKKMPNPIAVIASFVVVLAAACAQHRPVSMDAERESLAERQTEFFAALSGRDADRAARLFADDAVLHVANMPPIEGRSAIRQFYGNMFNFLTASRATPEVLIVSASGDMAYGTGRAANEFRGPDGPVEYAGKYVMVWRKLEGDWRIVLYGVSSNQADAGR